MFHINFQPNNEQRAEAVSLHSKYELETVSTQGKLGFFKDLSRTKGGVLNWIPSESS